MKFLRPLLLLCTLALGSNAALGAMGAVPLQEPPPVSVPAGLAPADIAKAIKLSFIDRSWIVNKDQPGYIEATLNVRQHMLKVGVTYNASQIVFKYLDSAEMEYEERGGQRYIHPKFHNWTNNVVTDLGAKLRHLQVDH